MEERGCLLGMRHSSLAPSDGERARERGRAFTLIELLVVISIIGVLAGLTVGLSGLATRKSKESRLRGDMGKIINGIENYHSALGSYPPDHAVPDPAAPGRMIGLASPNQLFYELSGTEFVNNQFRVPGSPDGLTGAQIQTAFGSAGFANAARIAKDLKFTEEFKASQYKQISATPPLYVLAVPVVGPKNRRSYDPSGPLTWVITYNKADVNPWLYVSTSPTNNPDRYDLWCEVAIGGKVVRFSNWEKDPVVLSP